MCFRKIFDPFFATKTVGKGTGLELAIAYQIIVNKNAGNIVCESTPGEGTQFTVLLPYT
jgi:histidine kinase